MSEPAKVKGITPEMSRRLLHLMMKDPRYPRAELMAALKSIKAETQETNLNETSMSDNNVGRIIYTLIKGKSKQLSDLKEYKEERH